MSIIDKYLTGTLGSNIDFRDSFLTKSESESTYRNDLDTVTKTKKPGWINIPHRKSLFVATICFGPDDLEERILYLKSFNIPQFGLSFSQDKESMWYPMPEVVSSKLSIEGYIHKDTASNLTYLYNRQYRFGLLKICRLPSITIYRVDGFYDKTKTKIDKFFATTIMRTLYKGIAQGSVDFSVATEAEDIISDLKVSAKISKEKNEPDVSVFPYATFENCQLSCPTIDVDPASNDFATIKLEVSYSYANFDFK